MSTSDAVLSSKSPIAYVDIRIFAHATEDLDKVLTAARNILPAGSVDMVSFNKANLTGHHGNPITLYEARVKDKKLAQTVFTRLCSGLGILDKELLSGEIVQHLDKGNLYLRLDKQSAYLGELRLGSTDPIHVQIHFKKHGTEEVVETCRNLGLLP